ncbi:2,3-bisphosphoglycerate-independent phosphoglycerate mutase, partial [Candidatus Bipolaricaulota bacterium]|nr:2,3-bisphosphoglycerate-independent phosphoglycerate mutase [Candidatus Bipolaricaulota bacterium]
GSDTAHLSLLGYDPYEVYAGRGVFECLGIGMSVQPGDVCFRANFATVTPSKDGFIVKDRRAGRISSGQHELAEALSAISLERSAGVEFEFRASTQHRGALLLRGKQLSPFVTDNDPHESGKKAIAFQPLSGHDDEAACRTATAMNELVTRSYEVLYDHPVNRQRMLSGEHPANYILARGASILPYLDPIETIYGVRGAVIAGGALYRGIALACGMERIDAPGATGGIDTDLRSKAKTALEALETFDYVFIHVKGTDNAGHDKDAAGKTSFIERIDAELIGPLMDGIDWNATHLAFTGDHTTPIDYGDHTAEPVPVLFVGPNVRQDSTIAFGERDAGRGGLGRWSGKVLPILLNYNNWAPKFGS